MKALTLTQPWAWLVVHGGKHVENRVWNTNFRGKFLIHAAKGMPSSAYDEALEMARRTSQDVAGRIPPRDEVERGGIVGSAWIDFVLEPTAEPTVPWHMPYQYGFMLGGVEPLPFLPCKGALGFWGDFEIRDGQAVQIPTEGGR